MTERNLLDSNEYLSTHTGAWPSVLVQPDDVLDSWNENASNVFLLLGYKLKKISEINKRALERAHMRMTGDIS